MPSRTPISRFPARHAVALGVVWAAVVAAYANGLHGDFVLDSRVLVLENPVVHEASAANLLAILTRDYWQPMATDGLYRPLTILSYLANWVWLGNRGVPYGYHVVNLLLHLGCVAGVYALVVQLGGRPWVAACAAALFGLHPVTTEAVTNVVGRADLLATLGVLGALLCHARAPDEPGRRARAYAVATVACAVLAFFSKESGLVLVALLPAWDLLVRGRLRRSDGLDGVIALAVVYAGIRWAVASAGLPAEEVSPIDNPLVEAGFWQARLTALVVLGREIALLAWPWTLSADYSYRAVPVVGSVSDALPLVLVVAVAAAAAEALRRPTSRTALGFLLAFAALAWLPTSNLLVLTGSIMAERFLYLPLVGVAGAVAFAGESLAAGRMPAAAAVAIAVLVACGWRTHARNLDWDTDLDLWTSAVSAVPESAKARRAHASMLFGADPEHRGHTRALEEAERAVAIRPDYLDGLVDLGSFYIVEGDLTGDHAFYGKAIDVLERARVLEAAAWGRFVARMVARGVLGPDIPQKRDANLFNNLSVAYVRAERFEPALAVYEESRRLDPSDPRHYVDISAVLLNLGRWEDAATTLFAASLIAPTYQEAPRRLVEVYRTYYPGGRAIIESGPDNIQINLDDAVVRRHRCRAWRGLAGIYADAHMADEAARARQAAEGACGGDDGG